MKRIICKRICCIMSIIIAALTVLTTCGSVIEADSDNLAFAEENIELLRIENF